MVVYFNNQFLPREDVHISPEDRGFLLADGAYEMLRSYQGYLFKAEAHQQRLERSLRELRLQGVDTSAFPGIAERLVAENHLKDRDATVYIQVTRGAAPRRHAFPADTAPTIYIAATPFEADLRQQEQGIRCILQEDLRWGRCDIKSIALLANVLAHQHARDRQAEEALFVRHGAVLEGTHSNFALVEDETLVTPPLSNRILAGITRRTVLDLCGELGIPSREAPVTPDQILRAREALIMGTTVEITPVVRVDDHTIAGGRPGPVTRRLQHGFRRLTQDRTRSGVSPA